jgi:hypothetical protein
MPNTISDISGDNRIVMTSNGRFARQPLSGIFSSWSVIRVGIYFLVRDSGANITGTIRLAVGLCSGSSNIPGDASVTHFVGAIVGSSPWTRTTVPVVNYTGSNVFPAKIVGATTSFGTVLGGHNVQTTALQMLFVDITKGSPNFSFTTFQKTSTTTLTSPTFSDFETQFAAGVPAFSQHVVTGAQTVAVNEGTDGTLDHACVWWNQTSPAIDIAAWKVRRLS